MRLRTFRWAAASVATTSLVVACNLDDDYYFGAPPSFGGASGGTFFDAGRPAEPRSPCDDAVDGQQCTGFEVTSCEAKELANRACNAMLRCVNGYLRSGDVIHDECNADCPSAYVADRPDGCAVPNAGTLICEYPEGTCGCAPVRPVGEDAGDGGDGSDDTDRADAGDVDAGPTTYEWRCVTPQAGCPRIRPAAGSSCVRPMTCDYGSCLFEDGVTMRCYDGAWVSDSRCDR